MIFPHGGSGFGWLKESKLDELYGSGFLLMLFSVHLVLFACLPEKWVYPVWDLFCLRAREVSLFSVFGLCTNYQYHSVDSFYSGFYNVAVFVGWHRCMFYGL